MTAILTPDHFDRLGPATFCRSIQSILGLTILTFLLAPPCLAQDWPQINGPDRNGVALDEKLDTARWPAESLAPTWSHPVGQGFSGPVVKAEKVIIFHRPRKDYLCEALNATTGKAIWNRTLPAVYRGGGPDGDLGPKATPIIDDNRVYLLGTGGELYCLDLADGKTIWKRNIQLEYKSPPGYFGSGSTPIIHDGKLIVNVGGREAAVVAFDKTNGKEVWKSFDDRASYSSPVVGKIKGQPTILMITRLHFIGLSPENGQVLFKTKFGVTGPSVNGAMPLFQDGKVFINSAYGVGAKWIDIRSGKLDIIWENDDSFSSQYSTPILIDGYLYGTAGREDFRNGSFRCVEAETGRVKWSKSGVPVGHAFLVGSQILLLDSEGYLHAINPSPNRFELAKKVMLFDSPARSIPAISNGKLYARSNSGGRNGELGCFQIGVSK